MKQVNDEPVTPVIQEANLNYSSGDEEWKASIIIKCLFFLEIN